MKNRLTVGLAFIALLGAVASFGYHFKNYKREPVNTQARVVEVSRKVEFVDRCVNGKQALIVKAFDDFDTRAYQRVASTYMLWNVDMAGRPIQCSEPNEVGMK